ncbi:hypothetical protein C4585_01340 [Candidatus Parcubacteria bacterium]|nr:MAG: hypothetical protein C4585_01340 [Candidatus Parcubacteria bacterium]
MTLDTLIIITGAAVAALPFLGFPSTWDKVIFLLLGVFVLSLGIALRRRGYTHTSEPKESDIFQGRVSNEHDSH